MIKLLLITHNYQYAGAQLVLYQLAKGLAATQQYDISVYGYGPGPLKRDYALAGILPYGGSNECCIPQMELTKPDLVIGNTVLSHWAVEAARVRGIPTLWWIHEGAWAKQVLWHPHMLDTLLTTSELVVSSHYLKSLYDAVETGRGFERHTRVIKYGIPATQEPTPKDTKAPIRFLVAGTIEWRKGQDMALDAWKRVGSPDATLTFIGGNWASAYSQQIAHRSLAIPNVYCAPVVDPGVFAGLLDSFDVLLVPSRDEGGYPQVLLQAQERGKLVIAADICGIREQVEDRVTGLITSNWDCSISGVSQSWYASNTCLHEIRQQGRDWVHKNNSLVEHLDQWQKLIEEVI